MSNVLYRFYSATGQLLYVGMTINPAQRFKSHQETKSWWDDIVGITLEHYDSREDLANAERRAIQVERPLHNVVRAKPKPAQQVYNAIPSQTVEPSDTFIRDMFADLFRFNNEAEQRREAQHRAYWKAIADCPSCDDTGYRGMYVCNHIEMSRRATRKNSLQVIDGGI